MSPTSYQTAPPRDWKAYFNTPRRSRRSEPCLAQGLDEAAAVLVADQAGGANLLAAGVEEDRPRRAEQAEPLQQRAVIGVVRRDVGLQQQRAGELLLHRGLGEREALHLLARDAPVGVEIEHHRAAGRAQGGVELVDAPDALEARHAGRRVDVAACRESGERLERIGRARGRADDLE